jgi:hypothetical protein
MVGILEKLLRERYGQASIVASTPLVEYRWNEGADALRCTLYKLPDSPEEFGEDTAILRPVYGDAAGGFLLGAGLKVSMIRGPRVFGLYQWQELQVVPDVVHADQLDPAICFFMDSANVWFYGLKGDRLYVYDSETGELDSLGLVQPALATLLGEWEEAKA